MTSSKSQYKDRDELILNHLSKYPCSYKKSISEALRIPEITIFKRVQKLERNGFVVTKKIGQFVYVCLEKDSDLLNSFAEKQILESNHGRRSKFRVLGDGTEQKWCNGCEQFLSIDQFGYLKKGYRGFQHRCMSCLQKKAKMQYMRSKELGRDRNTISMHKKKPLFKKLKMRQFGVRKKCPSCGSIIYVDPSSKEGFCHIHSVKYSISKSLSDSNRSGKAHGIMLKLIKPELFIKDRILDCLPRYQHQIARKFMISVGYTKKIVCELENDGLVNVKRGKNYTWVEAC